MLFRSTAPAVNDLLAGQIQILFDSLSTALPNLRAGKVRAIGVTNSSRSPSAPDIPTLAEGGVAGYEAFGWFGIVAPAQVPSSIIDLLNREIDLIIRSPDVEDRLKALGAEISGGPPSLFAALIKDEAQRWGQLIREAGIRTD